ncbi:MAG: TolC family protein [Acidiferrobacter sp.]
MGRFGVTLVITLLWGFPGAALAQIFTLQQAVDFALTHNSATIVARAEEHVAKNELRMARSQGSPQANVSYGYLFSNDPLEALSAELNRRQVTAQDFVPNTLNHPGITRLGTTTLSVSWPLYMGGARHDSVLAGRFGQKAAHHLAQRVRQRIIAHVISAYEGLVMAQAAARIADQAVAAANHHAQTTQHLYVHGRIVHSDALTAAINLGANQELLAEAQGDVKTATENLAFAMGAPNGLAITVPDNPPAIAALPTKHRAYYLQEALTNRPDIKALRAKARAMQAQVRAVRAQSSFHVMLMAQSQWFSQTPALRHNAWTVGAVVSKSLYDGHHNRDHADVLQERVAALDGQLVGLTSRIRYSVTVAYENMRIARHRYNIAYANIQRAKHAVALIQVRYGEGRTILLELLNVEQSLVQAREAALGALYALASNRAALAAACGTLSAKTVPSLGLPS